MVHEHLKGMVLITRSWRRSTRNKPWSPFFSDTMSELSDQEPAVIKTHTLSGGGLQVCDGIKSHVAGLSLHKPSCDNWASAFSGDTFAILVWSKGPTCGKLAYISLCRNVRDPEGCFSLITYRH